MKTNCYCADVRDLTKKLSLVGVNIEEARFITDEKPPELKDTQSIVGIVFANKLQKPSVREIVWLPQCDTCLSELKVWLDSQKTPNE